MAANKTSDLGQRCPVGGGIYGAHQQTGDVDGLRPKMALQATCRSQERWALRRLIQSVEYCTSLWVHRRQINHRAAGNPADGNIIAEVNSSWSARSGLFAV